jgi:predicted phosphodiesterase
VERIFFIPDLHCPYEDKRATELMFDAMSHFRPDTVVIMGDFIDCLAVSHWSKDPRRAQSLKQEVDKAKSYLDRITARRKVFIAGNHEDRLQRYLQEKAPELLEFVDIPSLLDLEKKKWEYVPYKASTTIGKIHITHDVGSAGRYNAYKALDTFQASIVTGHTHRLAYVVEGDATGSCQVSTQFGWLGDVEQISYMHEINAKRNWALGMGYGYHDRKTGLVYLVPAPIVNYSVAIEGTILTRPRRPGGGAKRT